MLKNIPSNPTALINWKWEEIALHYKDLAARPLTASNADGWLADWSRLGEHLEELYARLQVATSVNTTDKEADERMNKFLNTIYPNAMAAEQKLKEKLLASGLEPKGFEIPLRNMRAEADLFRQANLPLLAEEKKYNLEYDKILGAQTVQWDGEEVTLTKLKTVFQEPERAKREKAWRAIAERQLADRKAINELWQKYMPLRGNIARNADKPSYREYAWQQRLRFDFTAADCKSFHQAIEEVVIPAATRIYARRRKALGVDTLRPWDLEDGWYSRPTPPAGEPALKPFTGMDELKASSSAIFHKVDPVLGGYFDTMLRAGLTDLDNRKNKAPGAFCTSYTSIRKPFIFVNAVGTHDDVQTTLHESGHAFHVFETANIQYVQQLSVPMEFAEVASMGMELLAAPYLTEFYTAAEAARARIEHHERSILFWPFMAVVDAFQHWVYENPTEGAQPDKCDAKWAELWRRFIPGVDWSGLEDVISTGWQRKLHIHQYPFYYTEYGMAQLGAVQIWDNAIKDQAGAVSAYRKALALGGTVTLPELFAAAGAKFAFDSATLKKAVDLMERVIEELEA